MATQSVSRSGCCSANLINAHENGNSKNASADRTFFQSTSSAPDPKRNDMGILNPASSIPHFPNGQAYIAALRIPVLKRIEKPIPSFLYLPLLKPHLNIVLVIGLFSSSVLPSPSRYSSQGLWIIRPSSQAASSSGGDGGGLLLGLRRFRGNNKAARKQNDSKGQLLHVANLHVGPKLRNARSPPRRKRQDRGRRRRRNYRRTSAGR